MNVFKGQTIKYRNHYDGEEYELEVVTVNIDGSFEAQEKAIIEGFDPIVFEVEENGTSNDFGTVIQFYE